MEYSKLISVTGLGGLFELVASKSDGAIIRSLDDKSTKFVSSRQHSFSHLESIEVYTVRDNVNLVDVFNAMGESKESLPSEKDPAAIKKYFTKVYPDLDFDRVYASDMKKMVKWFAVLKSNDIEIKLREEAPEEEVAEQEEVAVDRRHHHQGEHDQADHRHGHARPEPRGQRIRNTGLERRHDPAPARSHLRDRREEDIGVVDHEERSAAHHYHSAQEEHLDVAVQFPNDRIEPACRDVPHGKDHQAHG